MSERINVAHLGEDCPISHCGKLVYRHDHVGNPRQCKLCGAEVDECRCHLGIPSTGPAATAVSVVCKGGHRLVNPDYRPPEGRMAADAVQALERRLAKLEE